MNKKGVVGAVRKRAVNAEIASVEAALAKGMISRVQLRGRLEASCHEQMQKGARKLWKKGIEPTVDLLLEDYRANDRFRKLAAKVGLSEMWFVGLARAACETQPQQVEVRWWQRMMFWRKAG